MKQSYFYLRQVLVACGASLILMQLSASAANLVSRYSFNATSGTNATDSVGGYTATLRGGSSFNGAGKVVLNGTNSYVNLPPAQLSGLTAITIDSWFSFTVPNNNVHLFSIDNGNGSGSGGSFLRYNVFDNTPANGHGGTNFIDSDVSWSDHMLPGGSVLPTNNTQVHVTLVYDPVNGVESIYVNGVLSSTYSGSVAALSSYPQNVFTLGRSPWVNYGDLYLKGSINEFRIYNTALSAAEISATDALGSDQLLSTNRPQVGLALTGTNVTVSWPLANAGLTLQSRTNLASGNWVNLTSPAPQIVSNQWQVTLPPTNAGSVFYRLMK